MGEFREGEYEPANHDELLATLERVEAKLDRILAHLAWGGSAARPAEDNAEDRPDARTVGMAPALTPDQIKTLANLGLGGTPCSDFDSRDTDPEL